MRSEPYRNVKYTVREKEDIKVREGGERKKEEGKPKCTKKRGAGGVKNATEKRRGV